MRPNIITLAAPLLILTSCEVPFVAYEESRKIIHAEQVTFQKEHRECSLGLEVIPKSNIPYFAKTKANTDTKEIVFKTPLKEVIATRQNGGKIDFKGITLPEPSQDRKEACKNKKTCTTHTQKSCTPKPPTKAEYQACIYAPNILDRPFKSGLSREQMQLVSFIEEYASYESHTLSELKSIQKQRIAQIEKVKNIRKEKELKIKKRDAIIEDCLIKKGYSQEEIKKRKNEWQKFWHAK